MRQTSVGRLFGVFVAVVLFSNIAQAAPEMATAPLEMTPQNTVIVNSSTYAGAALQHCGFEIFFGPPAIAGADSAPFAQYIVNALGSFRSFKEAAGNRSGVEAAVKLNRDAGTYSVEIALPLKGPKYDYTQLKELTFNIARNIYSRDNYQQDAQIGWYPIFATSYNLYSRGVIFLEK